MKDMNTIFERPVNRRSFIKNGAIAAGAATVGAGLLGHGLTAFAQQPAATGSLTKGDAAILRLLAAAEIIETDLWLQYAELGGVQDDEVAARAAQNIPGYPAKATGGNAAYTAALLPLDSDMPQYIHDNTDDELSHELFINAYLASKGADTVNLDTFRVLPSSKATGANQIGRLTNLMQLTVDTSWWTRYRSSTANPDLSGTSGQAATFPQAVPSLAVGQHPAIPRSDRDLASAQFTQAIANTAGFHFAFIEQGGSSLYPSLAQRVSNVEVLRILLSIGGTEIAHFQTWHDKAGNAPHVSTKDPVTGVAVSFPDLNASPFGGEDFQTNLIMPEPTVFLNEQFPTVSIIRPTETNGAATGAIKGFISDGLFAGQSNQFVGLLLELAAEADAAQREIAV